MSLAETLPLVQKLRNAGVEDETLNFHLAWAISTGDEKPLEDHLKFSGYQEQLSLIDSIEQIKKELVPFEDPPEMEGEIVLGTTLLGDKEIRISLADLNVHCLIDGSSGSGKTTLIRNLIKEITEIPL